MTNDQMRDKVRHMISAGYEDGGIAEYDEYNNMLQDVLKHVIVLIIFGNSSVFISGTYHMSDLVSHLIVCHFSPSGSSNAISS